MERIIRIDTEKLGNLLKATGLKNSDISKDAGYGSTYITNVLRTGKINRDMVVYLGEAIGIVPNAYVENGEKQVQVDAPTDAEKYFERYGKAMMLQLDALRSIAKTLEEIKAELHRHGVDVHNWRNKWNEEGEDA
jgi:hypothetical protein